MTYKAAGDLPAPAFIHGLPRQLASFLHRLRGDCAYTRVKILRIGRAESPYGVPVAHHKRSIISFSSCLNILHSPQCCFPHCTPYNNFASLSYPFSFLLNTDMAFFHSESCANVSSLSKPYGPPPQLVLRLCTWLYCLNRPLLYS